MDSFFNRNKNFRDTYSYRWYESWLSLLYLPLIYLYSVMKLDSWEIHKIFLLKPLKSDRKFINMGLLLLGGTSHSSQDSSYPPPAPPTPRVLTLSDTHPVAAPRGGLGKTCPQVPKVGKNCQRRMA